MSAVSQAQAAASADAVNQVLETSTKAAMDLAEKLMKVSVTMAVGVESGKGQNFDVSA
jgi:hypothetical protein